MQTPGPTILPLLIALPLIGWRVYGRVRRSIGRQPLSKSRPWFTVTLFPLLIVLFGFATLVHPEKIWWLMGAVVVGVMLGVFGLNTTKFENTPEGLFYTANTHLGIALSLLFVGRVVYRLIEAYLAGNAPQATPDFALSPLTLAVFGVLAGYYVTYAIGLIRWRREQEKLVV
jgi:hypothetical protein